MNTTFIADVHLGKLVKTLRLLGFDVLYSNYAKPAQLTELAREQKRVLLSRYTGFTRQLPEQTFIVESADPLEQLEQVIKHFSLQNSLQPFTRCLVCNKQLVPVSKEEILDQLEPNTREGYNEFWQCDSCRRIYWKGSHYQRMLQLVEHFSIKG